MKIPFLKPGTYTDMNGKKVTIKAEDLDKIILATKEHDYQDDDFPLCIGHPKTDDPAWGWVNKNSISKDGDVLVALADNDKLVPEFKDWFGKKLFKKVSVKLRQDYSIAHIGFLGAKAPAVAGLPSVALAAEEGTTIEFAEYEFSKWWFRTLGRIIRAIKNKTIEKDGVEAADKFISEYDLEEISNPPAFYEKQILRSFSEPDIENENLLINLSEEEMDQLKDLQNQITALTAKVTSYETENAKLKNENGIALSETQQLKLDQKRKTFLAFCESDDVKNKIKDGEKDSIIEAMLAIDSIQVIEFGEGEQKKSISVLDLFKNTLKNLKDVVELGERANNNTAAGQVESDIEFAELTVDQDRMKLHNDAKAKAKAENISYQEALKLVRK